VSADFVVYATCSLKGLRQKDEHPRLWFYGTFTYLSDRDKLMEKGSRLRGTPVSG